MTVAGWMGTQPLVIALLIVHFAAFVISTPGLIFRREILTRLGLILLIAAFALNTWIIADRWYEAGRAPFKTLYETLLFYPWCVAVVTLTLIGLHRLNILLPFSTAICVAGLSYALYRPDVEIVYLPPALQSAWFVPHVVTYFVAYAGLFASFVLAVMALLVRYRKRTDDKHERGQAATADDTNIWDEGLLERHAHSVAVFGTAALTLGLVMGAVWGKIAWGEYWSWDPKENWALVSWLAYVIYLHLRLQNGWGGRRAMWVLVVALGAIVFTYMGVNLLPTAEGSLHVYQ